MSAAATRDLVSIERGALAELIRAAKYAVQQAARERAVFTAVRMTTPGSTGRKNAETAFKQKRGFTDVAITDLWTAIQTLEKSL